MRGAGPQGPVREGPGRLISNFTGISDPYEEPRDADLVLDTAAMSRTDAVDAVLELLVAGGWLADPSRGR